MCGVSVVGRTGLGATHSQEENRNRCWWRRQEAGGGGKQSHSVRRSQGVRGLRGRAPESHQQADCRCLLLSPIVVAVLVLPDEPVQTPGSVLFY